jgi:hypothetical protein
VETAWNDGGKSLKENGKWPRAISLTQAAMSCVCAAAPGVVDELDAAIIKDLGKG